MKTIFVSCFHPYTSRNILSTDAFRLLVRAQDLRIVLFVHDNKTAYIKTNFADAHTIVEGISFNAPSSKSWAMLVMKRFAKFCLDSNSVRIQRYMKWKFEKKYVYLFLSFISKAVSHSRMLRACMRAFDYHMAEKDRYGMYFQAYHPDVVIITDVLNERDVELAQNARFFNVPVVGMVRSWDNLTLHGLMRFLPDLLLVASEEIKKQAEVLNDCSDNKVNIVGVAHYDKYVQGAKISREEFFRSAGLNSSRPTIFYAPIGDFYIADNTTDRHIVSLLGGMSANIIVRFSPTVPVKDMEGTLPLSANVYVDRPGVNFTKQSIGDQELSEQDDDRLLHELLYSDVIICGPSTVALDAVFLDKPVIIINFHPDARGYYDGIARRYDYDHFKFAIDCGAFRLANSKEEFFSLIEQYKKDSSLDAKARAVLRTAYCGPHDGMSGARIARAIVDFLKFPQRQ